MISAYCHFVFTVLILSYLRNELQLLKNGRQNSLFRQPMGFCSSKRHASGRSI